MLEKAFQLATCKASTHLRQNRGNGDSVELVGKATIVRKSIRGLGVSLSTVSEQDFHSFMHRQALQRQL